MNRTQDTVNTPKVGTGKLLGQVMSPGFRP